MMMWVLAILFYVNGVQVAKIDLAARYNSVEACESAWQAAGKTMQTSISTPVQIVHACEPINAFR